MSVIPMSSSGRRWKSSAMTTWWLDDDVCRVAEPVFARYMTGDE
jgi:hypothetical protein